MPPIDNPGAARGATLNGERTMTKLTSTFEAHRSGKVGWALLWLLGVPLPVLIVLYFLTGGGCG